MRSFFKPVPASDRRDEFRRVRDYEMAGFDLTAFWIGRRFGRELPADVRLLVGEGPAADYMHTPLSWPLYSDRAADVIRRRASADVEFVRAPLYHHKTGRELPGYWILNAVRRVPCIDFERSGVHYDDEDPTRIYSINPLVLDLTRIPADVHVFRPDEHIHALLFSSELVHDFDGMGMRDMAYLRC